MRTFTDYRNLDGSDRGASVAIGNFDGVHKGHIAVIEAARAAAGRLDRPLGVVTFEPHPRAYFRPDLPGFRLTNAEARAHRLQMLGVDRLYQLVFGPELAGLSPDAFAGDVLAGGLGIAHAVVGEDFRFGKGRAGTAQGLQRLGARFGFGVTVAELVGGPDGEVSSTAIRKALAEGRPGDAAGMLGHWHLIEGAVIEGARRGRELGYPTANMALGGLSPPRFGVYAARVEVKDGPHAGRYDGAASIGVRPMFGENRPNLETYLLDFAGDLYGAHLSVALVEFLRPEERFDDVAALTAQMAEDCEAARAALRRAPFPSGAGAVGSGQ